MDLPFNMQLTVTRSSFAAAAIGIPGAFGAHVDVPAIAAIWTGMLLRLSAQAGSRMENGKAMKVAAGVLAGIGLFKMGFKLANTYIAYTGIGTIPAVVANAGANGTVTYLFGRSAGKLFLSENKEDSVEGLIKGILTLMTGVSAENINVDASSGSIPTSLEKGALFQHFEDQQHRAGR
jgi:uncharacterized protein (DUF697 family)